MQLTFKILILYPNTLMNSCISSNHFSVGPLGFSVYKVTSPCQSLWVKRVFFFLSDLDAYSLANTSKESTNCFSLQPPLFLNSPKGCSSFHLRSYTLSNWETPLVAQMVKSLPAMQQTRVRSLDHENPLEKKMAMHSSILAWKIPWME